MVIEEAFIGNLLYTDTRLNEASQFADIFVGTVEATEAYIFRYNHDILLVKVLGDLFEAH